MFIRVSVCDTSILGVAGLESNCVGYGSSSQVNGRAVYPIYKPQGLIQQYANQIKYGVVGYLNTNNTAVQGGVLREPMNFVGPTYPQPLTALATTNTTDAEWSATTGIMNKNPDPNTASASGVPYSGVMNYLNKFGEYGAAQYLTGSLNYPNNTNIYMTYDHVSEMYYAGIRYFENLGNVTQWAPQSAYGPTSVQLDGFPAVTTWVDPIAYSCQKNFILGIGDDHTWTDWNVAVVRSFHRPMAAIIRHLRWCNRIRSTRRTRGCIRLRISRECRRRLGSAPARERRPITSRGSPTAHTSSISGRISA